MISNVSAMVVTAMLFLVAYAWIALIAKLLRGETILPFEPRREVPWGWIAVAVSFFIFIGSQIAVGLAFGARPDAELTVTQTDMLLTWTALATLAATLTSLGLLHVLARADRENLGISLVDAPRDLFLGLYAFLVLGPITFLIQFVFVYVFELESHHPLIELLKQDDSGKLFGVVTLLAVIVAPVSEEYFFRVLLQGWLERHFLFRNTYGNEGERDDLPSGTTTNHEANRASFGFTPEHDANPYSSPSPTQPLEHRSAQPLDHRFVASATPIIISAGIFALMHWSHGPDPAALFVLALGLGYLYQRTHRWLPCVVTHACLNGTTMMMLWFGLDQLPS